jgi:undecaprenyl-diphosphatase
VSKRSGGGPPALVGAIFAGLAAYFAVRFLMRFFERRDLKPFAICCLA